MERVPTSLEDLKARVKAAREALDPPDEWHFRNGPEADAFQYVITGPVQDRLKWPSHFSTEAYYKRFLRPDWQNVDPRIVEFSQRFLVALAKESVPFYVHAAYRTRREQNDAVARGVSKTPWPRAAHCQGKAVDVVHSRYHWELSKPEWDWIGHIGKQVHAQMMRGTKAADRWQISWGGDWRTLWDPAHWEVSDWRSDIRVPVDADPVRIPQAPYAWLRLRNR